MLAQHYTSSAPYLGSDVPTEPVSEAILCFAISNSASRNKTCFYMSQQVVNCQIVQVVNLNMNEKLQDGMAMIACMHCIPTNGSEALLSDKYNS